MEGKGQCRVKRMMQETEGANKPEVGPQVQDLPDPEHDQDEGGAEAEPLDPVVGALVGVAQLLLARPQVVHLAHDLGDHLLHTAKVRLDRLELLGGLDRGPVLCVGADVDVEFHVAGRVAEVPGCLQAFVSALSFSWWQ